MAGPFAQVGFDLLLELGEPIQGNEGLDGSGEAAAVDTAGTLAAQMHFTQSQRHSHLLMIHRTGGRNVLQIHPGAAAGFVDQLQECIKVIPAQCFCHLLDPVIFLVDMQGSKDRTVGDLTPKLRELPDKLLSGDLPQIVPVEAAAQLRQFLRDRCVFIGQIRMICTGIDNAQAVSVLCQIHIQLLNLRLSGVCKVNVDHAADSGCHLIHQAAGLAEVDILGILADLGDFHGRQLLVEEQLVEDRADQNFECSRGTQAASGKYRGVDSCPEAGELSPKLDKPACNATDQCSGGVFLILTDSQIIQLNGDRRISIGFDLNGVGLVQPNNCLCFQIHCSCEDTAVLVVGVVAADLRPARSGEMVGLVHINSPFQRGASCWPSPHSAWSAGR